MEKQRVFDFLKTEPHKGHSWCLIATSWFEQWKKFVGYDDSRQIVRDEAKHPGVIDNSPLLRDDGSGKLKDGLMEIIDYILIPKEGFDFLTQIYGLKEDQKAVVRPVIEYGRFQIKTEVDIYKRTFHIFLNKDDDHITVMKFRKNVTIGYIEQRIRKLFGIPDSTICRISCKRFDRWEVLEEPEDTIVDVGLHDNQNIMLEEQKEDGSWPSEERKRKHDSPAKKRLRLQEKGESDRGSSSQDLGESIAIQIEAVVVETSYNMNYRRKGFCYIFNNKKFDAKLNLKERIGSEEDVVLLFRTFNQFGFTPKIFTDLRVNEIKSQIKKVSRDDHTENCCLMIIIMTHGSEKDMLCARDGTYNLQEDIFNQLIEEKNETLIGKPKIFFIQACRGAKMDLGVPITVETTAIQTESSPHIQEFDRMSICYPGHADFIIHHSSTSGYKSTRTHQGTPFICEVCDTFTKYADKETVFELMTIVNRRVANYEMVSKTSGITFKQMPSVTSTLTKKLKLFEM